MRRFSVALTALLLGASLALGLTAGWAQTSAPPVTETQKAPETPKAAPSTEQPTGATTPAPAPQDKPGTTAQDRPGTTTPEGRVPGSPGERTGDTTVFGISQTAAIIVGLVILGIIVALVAMSRRDRDVVTRVERDVRVYERDRDVLDDRDRPRKVS